MAIPEGHSTNLDTIIHAAHNNRLCLLECTNKAGEPVITLCAVNEVGDEFEFIPLAKMFDGNPFEELQPPV